MRRTCGRELRGQDAKVLPCDTLVVQRWHDRRTIHSHPSAQAAFVLVVPHQLHSAPWAGAQADLLPGQLPSARLRAAQGTRRVSAARTAHHPAGWAFGASTEPSHALRSRRNARPAWLQDSRDAAGGLRRARRAASNPLRAEAASERANVQRGPGGADLSNMCPDRSNPPSRSSPVPLQRPRRIPSPARRNRHAALRTRREQSPRAPGHIGEVSLRATRSRLSTQR